MDREKALNPSKEEKKDDDAKGGDDAATTTTKAVFVPGDSNGEHLFYSMLQIQNRIEKLMAPKPGVPQRTKAVTKFGKELLKCPLQSAMGRYGAASSAILCDGCGRTIDGRGEMVYHCVDGKKDRQHPDGFDLCIQCGDKQLRYGDPTAFYEDMAEIERLNAEMKELIDAEEKSMCSPMH